jgi:K(+)-stimulated pyrophosphate-energized sodium pump
LDGCEKGFVSLPIFDFQLLCLTTMFPWFYSQLKAAPRGNDVMNGISDKIKSGARAFLVTEYKYLSIFIAVVFTILVILYSLDPPTGDKTDGIRYGACFLAGAVLSASAGWNGMAVATDANVRTTQAAKEEGLGVALRVAFTGGSVMGFTVVGLGLLGLSMMYYLVSLEYQTETFEARLDYAADALSGFGFGASSIALFARVAGGIFTKVSV